VAELTEKLGRDTSFVYLARGMERPEASRILDLQLPGIHGVTDMKRVYPAGPLASQVIGFVGVDNSGLEGLEFGYDDALSGTPGQLVMELDGSGDGVAIPQGEYQMVPAVPGADVVTTIDGEIQYFAERTLADQVARSQAAGGVVVVLDTATSEILAMATYPTFDPNSVASQDPASFRNRAVTDVFEPGSTAKLITVSAAIEEGIVRPATTFTVPDSIEVSNRTYTDYKSHPAAVMDVDTIIGHSSNVGTILIWQKLGNPLLYRYLESFGLGRLTGVDLPGELAGSLRPVEEWCDSCGASTAIGYRVSVTPLQMTSVFATVGNDGLWTQPGVVKEIRRPDGTVEQPDHETQRVLSGDVARTMRLMMERVVVDGTGTLAAVPGQRVGGKTGTTRKYVEATQSYGDDVVASFIGLGPVEHPRLAVGVFIDSPRATGLDSGGTAAAPVFSKIMEFALLQVGVGADGG
jgi:cell division protein FtsI (penicillin-binding protein 3)